MERLTIEIPFSGFGDSRWSEIMETIIGQRPELEYPRHSCQTDFTTALGGQGSKTAKRPTAGIAMMVGAAFVTKIPTTRPRPL